MRRICLLVPALLSVASAKLSAQIDGPPVKIEPALTVGMERSRMNGTDADPDLKSLMRPTVGLALRFTDIVDLGFETGIRFSPRGFDSQTATANVRYTTNWLSFPVLARYERLDRRWSPLLVAGGEFALRLSCNYETTSGPSTKLECEKAESLDRQKKASLGIIAGGGVSHLTRRATVAATVRWTRGLTPVSDFVSGGNDNHFDSFTFQLELARRRR